MNEYVHNDLLLAGAFLYLFPLGRSPFKGKGTVEPWRARQALLQCDKRMAREIPLTFVLANQRQRHAVQRGVSARVKDRASAANAVEDLLEDPAFFNVVEKASADPKCEEAKRLRKTVLPFMQVSARQVPWSKHERSSCIGRLYSLARRYGPTCGHFDRTALRGVSFFQEFFS